MNAASPGTTVASSADVRFNPFSAAFRENPYETYHQLRRHKPVYKTLGMWVLTRHADVQSVLRGRSFSAGLIPELIVRHATRFGYNEIGRVERLAHKSLVFTDNPDHARLRRLVNRVFTREAFAALRPRVRTVAEGLRDEAWRAGGMDVVSDLAYPLPLAVMADWMALPPSWHRTIGQWTHDIRFLLEPGLMKADDFAHVCDVVEQFAQLLHGAIAERRRAPGEDLISMLLTAESEDGDRLSEEELIFVCIMCFVAGNETTKSLIGNAVMALMDHPEQAAKLRRTPQLVSSAVNEALRYESPLQQTKRVASKDIEVGGEPISEGDQILLCIGAANRDPEVFASPDTFDIEREAEAHLAFGYGMHGCLGGALAQLQAEEVLRCLYSRPEYLAPVDEPRQWQDHSLIVRGLKRLPASVVSSR